MDKYYTFSIDKVQSVLFNYGFSGFDSDKNQRHFSHQPRRNQ